MGIRVIWHCRLLQLLKFFIAVRYARLSCRIVSPKSFRRQLSTSFSCAGINGVPSALPQHRHGAARVLVHCQRRSMKAFAPPPPLRRRCCVYVTDLTANRRICDIGDAWLHARYTFRSNSFRQPPPTTCQLVHLLRPLRLLRLVTTRARCRQIFNMLKIRAGAVTSLLRRKNCDVFGATGAASAQQETHWCAEVAPKMGLLSVATSSSWRPDPAKPRAIAVDEPHTSISFTVIFRIVPPI